MDPEVQRTSPRVARAHRQQQHRRIEVGDRERGPIAGSGQGADQGQGIFNRRAGRLAQHQFVRPVRQARRHLQAADGQTHHGSLLGGLGEAGVPASPTFVLELEVLDGDGVGPGVEIGQGLIFRSPSSGGRRSARPAGPPRSEDRCEPPCAGSSARCWASPYPASWGGVGPGRENPDPGSDHARA